MAPDTYQRDNIMATRSTISVVNSDGTVNTIYCHYDGYLDCNGDLLVNNYAYLDAVQALIAHGDMVALDKTIDECTFFYRDRNETYDETRPRKFPAVKYYEYELDLEEYNYIYDGEWKLFARGHSDSDNFRSVAELLKNS